MELVISAIIVGTFMYISESISNRRAINKLFKDLDVNEI